MKLRVATFAVFVGAGALASILPCLGAAGGAPVDPENPTALAWNQDVLKLEQTVLAAVRNDKLGDAITAINARLKLQPNDSATLLLSAVVRRIDIIDHTKDFPTVKPYFQKVIDLAPRSPEAQIAKLMIQVETGVSPIGSLRLLNRFEGSETIATLKAIAIFDAGRFEDAQRALAALARGPRLDLIYFNALGRAGHFQLAADSYQKRMGRGVVPGLSGRMAADLLAYGQIKDATTAANNALLLQPKNLEGTIVLGRILFQQGHFQEAFQKASAALDIDATSTSAHILAGQSLEHLDKVEEAFTHYRAVAGVKPAAIPPLMDKAKAAALAPAEGLNEVLRYVSMGRQSDAEAITLGLEARFPTDIDVCFTEAAFIRSRFDVQRAAERFLRVARVAAGTPRGICAVCLLNIDARHNTDANFDHLCDLAETNSDDVLITWMAAVACRTLNRNPEGVVVYSSLMKHFFVGPSLTHQTFANILDQLNDYETALAHRKLAVKLEPAGWSYDGLGNTLAGLRDYAAADAAHNTATTLQPDIARNWCNWGIDLYQWGHYEEAMAKLTKAIAVDPKSANALTEMGLCLEALHRVDDAVTWYQKAIDADHAYPYPVNNLARIYESRGQPEKAAEVRKRFEALNRPPAPVERL